MRFGEIVIWVGLGLKEADKIIVYILNRYSVKVFSIFCAGDT